jgi:hypothetical protein
LCHKHYGPDIFHRVQDSVLEELGLPPGDVIHLKDGAVPWWNGPDTKRKRVDESKPNAREYPAVKCAEAFVAYKTRYDGEGGCQFSRPLMVGDDSSAHLGESIWYRCKALQDWFPIPLGYTVVTENNEDPFAV